MILILTRTIDQTDDATSNKSGQRLNDRAEGDTKETLDSLRLFRHVGCDGTSLSSAQHLREQNITYRVFLLIKPGDIMANNRGELYLPQLCSKIPPRARKSVDLQADCHRRKDSCNKIPQPTVSAC